MSNRTEPKPTCRTCDNPLAVTSVYTRRGKFPLVYCPVCVEEIIKRDVNAGVRGVRGVAGQHAPRTPC